jgi:hypothetical protein
MALILVRFCKYMVTKMYQKQTKIYQNHIKKLILFLFWWILLWFCFGFGDQNQKKYNFVLFWFTKIKMIDQFCFVLFCFVLFRICRCLVWTLKWLNFKNTNPTGLFLDNLPCVVDNSCPSQYSINLILKGELEFLDWCVLRHCTVSLQQLGGSFRAPQP